jgi:hypothetical protein
MKVVALESHSEIDELPYTGNLAISPDNELIAFLGDEMYILRTSDYSVFYHDTINTINGNFSGDGTRLYCIAPDSNDWHRHILIIDLQNNFDKTKIPIPEYFGFLSYLIPAHDETKLYLSFSLGTFTSLFAVYDIQADSIIFDHILSPGAGRSVQTPDGRYVFYTNPGTLLDGPPPPSEFYAYDAENNELIVINTKGVVEGPLAAWLPMGEVAVTPDGRWLAAAHSGGFNHIIALGINAMEITKYVKLGGPRMFYGFTCQYQR